jgi:hypothetical protein
MPPRRYPNDLQSALIDALPLGRSITPSHTVYHSAKTDLKFGKPSEPPAQMLAPQAVAMVYPIAAIAF